AAFGALACAATAGCGSQTASRAAAAPAPAPERAGPPAPSSVAGGADMEAEDAFNRRALVFKPPYPERRELFLPPQKPVDAAAVEQVGRPRVKLKGFANLDGLKALVSVDGVVSAVESGQFRGDVQVISIKPPRVTFQRDGHRWTESLYTPSN
ncbi:MAG: hypothetical protein WD278_18975, partial [Pirellulales bacterium]